MTPDPTWSDWLRRQTAREDPVGEFARVVVANADRDGGPVPRPAGIRFLLAARGAPREEFDVLDRARAEFRTLVPPGPVDPNSDLFAGLRPLDGTVVTVASSRFLEDPDGFPLGVERVEDSGSLILPAPPGALDDDEEEDEEDQEGTDR